MENIEIRSEKVRSFIGKIPPRMIRIGNLVILIIIFISSLIGLSIKIPHTIHCDVIVKNESDSVNFYVQSISETIDSPIKKGCMVRVYKNNELILKGNLSDSISSIIITNEGNKITKITKINTLLENDRLKVSYEDGSLFKADLEIENVSIFQKIINK